MKRIPLTKGAYAIVDDEDYEFINSKKWYYGGKGDYARRNVWDKTNKVYYREFMHRVIMNPPGNMDVDHISGDKLDNRRQNLRIVTRSQNKANGSLLRHDNKSGMQGVHFDKDRQRWMAFISLQGKFYNLGRFKDIDEAKKVRTKAEEEYIAYGVLPR